MSLSLLLARPPLPAKFLLNNRAGSEEGMENREVKNKDPPTP